MVIDKLAGMTPGQIGLIVLVYVGGWFLMAGFLCAEERAGKWPGLEFAATMIWPITLVVAALVFVCAALIIGGMKLAELLDDWLERKG